MFVPLRVSTKSIGFLYELVGNLGDVSIDKENSDVYDRLLRSCTKADGTIDGTNLQQQVFPFDKTNYDVFISHSHADEEFALYLYAWLKKSGLNCFIDEVLWYSADELLKKIDLDYCKASTPGLIDYDKSLRSSGHVHTMLGMSMFEAINRSECCLFIESSNSLTLKDGIDNNTLSPWIYQEVQYANHMKPQLPPRLQQSSLRMFSEGGNILCESREFSRVEDSLKIEYKVDFSNFQEINHGDLYCMNGSGTKGLDMIYKKYLLKKPAVPNFRKKFL